MKTKKSLGQNFLKSEMALKKIIEAGEIKPDDIILIAGKGHETYQVFAHQTIVFDDREIVKEACRG